MDSSSGSDDKNGFKTVKIYKLGEKGSGIRLQGAVQDFYQLREECLLKRKLFEDPEFPAEDSSIFALERTADFQSKDMVWKRPAAIVENPQLFVEGPSRLDLKQGKVGNCGVIAALASLAMHKELLYQVVPQDQGFDKNYAGIFHFRFWQFGKWIEVVVDDRLPMYDGEFFCVSSTKDNEFWTALVEKAYAKLHGYWLALEGEYSGDAWEDFTGGISHYCTVKGVPSNSFDILLEAQEKNSLLGCFVDVSEDKTLENKFTNQGLVMIHAYSITKVTYIETKKDNKIEEIPFLRLRNPWGFDEWTGPWSDSSIEWESILENEKKKIGLVSEDEGEFWMSFQDWKNTFTHFDICYLNVSLMIGKYEKNWETSTFEGEWVRGVSAGGNTYDLETFQYNPQYRVTLKEESTVIVALMQKNRRTQRTGEDNFLLIGFHIYKLPTESTIELSKPLDVVFFEINEPLEIKEFLNVEANSEGFPYTYHRQVSCRTKLLPGAYCIIPTTWDPDQEGEFLLRVFSENAIDMVEYDDEIGIGEPDDTVREKADLDEDEVQLRSVFRKLAGDDWEFDWKEHKTILDSKLSKELSEGGFSKDTCRSMVALLDADYSGKIGYHEFRTFFDCVKIWKAAFNIYDENESHSLEPFQLRNVLKSAGFRLNNRILNLLMRRYGTEEGNVKFDDYFMCALRLKKIIGSYDEINASKDMNPDSFTLDNWIKAILNL